MSDWKLNSSVLFLIFNRPEMTQRAFNAIRKVKPQKLFVNADSPRRTKPGEDEKCQAARDVIKQVDWDCQVFTNFRDKNLGCKVTVSSGIDWFFENVEEGIILEDDVIAHPTFFRFCEELLERYRDDKRIAMITGNNFLFGDKRREKRYSYYFSRYIGIWGWATWRRTWKVYDVNMRLWPEIQYGDWLYRWCGNRRFAHYWTKQFKRIYSGEIDTWDFQLLFSCIVQNALIVVPNVNLVTNIGFGSEGTYCKDQGSKRANMKIEPMTFPLLHPPWIIRDSVADSILEERLCREEFFEFFENLLFVREIRRLRRSLR